MGGKNRLASILPTSLYWCVAGLFFMPALPRGVRPLIIALFLIGSFLSAWVEKSKPKWGFIFLNASLIFFYTLSLIYTEDLAYGFKKILTASSLLLFPLGFFSMGKRSLHHVMDRKHSLMFIFIIATTVLCLGAFARFYIDWTFDEVVLHFINVIRGDLGGWRIHPIYLSMHIGLALLFSLFIFDLETNKPVKFLVAIMDVFLILFLLMMIRKGPIIAIVLAAGYLVVVLKNKNLLLSFSIAVATLVGAIIFNPKVSARFSELLEVQESDSNMNNSTNIRYSIYKCVTQKVPQAGIMGFGIGDGTNELIDCYTVDSEFLVSSRYNSHNQYLGIILYVGYVGFFMFSLFLFYHFIIGLRKKNYYLVTILIFYCIMMLSENILERENGVVFFALFVSFFCTYNFKKAPLII